LAELKFLGYLAETARLQTKKVVIEGPTPLREILPRAIVENNVIILIDGKAGDLNSLIENGNSVVIMPILSGG
jgi:molybdopterin converting factor small subunit